MDYLKLTFTLRPDTETHRDLLSVLLANVGFESFVPGKTGLEAFIPQNIYSQQAVDKAIDSFPITNTDIHYQTEKIPDQNWNEAWETHYFDPIIIDNKVVIHSAFHRNVPPMPYSILIHPKMAFGTGHHETTALMLSYLANLELDGRSFLDMGCGTGILAILAALKGATPVTAVDIEDWACRNAMENIRLNSTPVVRVFRGDARIIQNKTYDYIFANINRNILLADIPAYAECMETGSHLFMSGFYTDDHQKIRKACVLNDLRFVSCMEKNKWLAVHYIK
jgi:ribosomal protein L11 methyltransferase